MPSYTRTGDAGQTGLFGGRRLPKSSSRIEAIGNVDELNASIGFARSQNQGFKKDDFLQDLQMSLFRAGADLATPMDSTAKLERITGEDTKKLEKEIDALDKPLKPLKHFILPGGTAQASALHLARSVCRRTERSIVFLSQKEVVNKQLLPFFNRLSSLLFVLARDANHEEKHKETEWKGA